ncbi:MAG: hypothetical protein U0Q16_19390 [Bryobacteraceae bacterium]
MRTLTLFLFLLPLRIWGQSNLTVSTVVGTGIPGYNGETGTPGGGPIAFSGISSLAGDGRGNLVIADARNRRVRIFSPATGAIRTVAGTGADPVEPFNPPVIPTPGLDLPLDALSAVSPGPGGSTYAASVTSIYQIRSDGVTTKVVGNGFRLTAGPAIGAFGTYTSSLALGPDNRLFFAIPFITDSNAGRVRVLENGTVRDITPNGAQGFQGEQLAIAFSDGQLYAADSGSKALYKIDVTTGTRQRAGSGSELPWTYPSSIAAGPDGVIFLADQKKHQVFRISLTGGGTQIVAGTGIAGTSGIDGPATAARLNEPAAVYFDTASKRLYIGEMAGSRLLYMDEQGSLRLAAGMGKPGYSGDEAPGPRSLAEVRASKVWSVATDSIGNVFWCESERIRRLSPALETATLVGNSGPNATPDGAAGADSVVRGCRGLALDGQSNIYYFDGDSRVKRYDRAQGTVRFLAGNGQSGASGTAPADGPSFRFFTGIGAIAVDRNGNVIVADTGNNVLRSVAPNGRVTTLAGTGQGTGATTVTTSAASAVLPGPTMLTLGRDGTVYFVTEQSVIRALTTAGEVRHVAGNGTRTTSGDGGPAKQAGFERIEALAVDSRNRIYVGTGNQIRLIDESGNVARFAGGTAAGFGGDGGPPANATFNSITGMAVDSRDNLYVADFLNFRLRRIGAVLPAARLRLVSSAAAIDTGASAPLAVDVLDSNGTGVAGVTVTFRAEGVGLSATSARSDAQGRATVNAIAGTDPGSARVVASAAGLPDLMIDLRIVGRLRISAVSNAFDESQSFAPGSLVNASLDQLKGAANGLAIAAGGVPVTVTATNASTFTFALPYTLDPGTVAITASEPGRDAASFAIEVAAAAPVILTRNGAVAAQNEDGSQNSAEAAAPAGSAVSVTVTGFGRVDGDTPIAGASAMVDDMPATVESFRVQAPGQAVAVIRVPMELTGGSGPRTLRFTLDGASTQGTIFASGKPE